jgi:NifU-like protein
MNQQEIEVRQVLNSLQPAMEADGGGIDLIAINGGCVLVKFKGACIDCPSIGLTMNLGITKTLQEKLPWVKEVVRVSDKKD